ncbi:zinc finger protein 665-like isoform X1 [Helicoverpa zea]|uniref:zinc finger protein 665-like isoform X1 n=1 Tax=Helicoverpa zea TaxID=7113 RepID=UPI001F5884EC|nr:zinc finger protein 665-like isoform X1 [Helicoverpa zea]
MNKQPEQVFIVNAAPTQPSSSPPKLMGVEVSDTSQVNLENVEDFSHVCRICATITEFVIPIFSGEGLQNNLADKIHKHLPIKVCSTDALPVVVCYQCASTLLAWHELVQCCVQADAALRARLDAIQQKSTVQIINDTPSTEDDALSKAEARRRECAYCGRWVAAAQYERHAVAAHAALLFHCAECGRCVPRKHFMPHMALHAVRYDHKHDQPGLAQTIPAALHDMRLSDITITHENDFSDHSDTEYGFGPLPESVFDAIEDSQDSQPFEDDDEHKKPLQNNIEISNIRDTTSSIGTSVLNGCIMSTGVLSDMSTVNSTSQTDDNSDTDVDISCATVKTEDSKKSHNKKSRKCPICGKVYTASSSYFYHMKYFHKGSREHGCQVCGKRFGTRSCLTQHMAVHSEQYEYECQQCQKRFKSKASLYIHGQTHGGKKAWSCAQCGAAFRWRASLARHAARHGAARHACGACGRAFAVRADLLRHARTHAAAQLRCTKCAQTFAQPRYLKVHMAKQHSVNLVNESH